MKIKVCILRTHEPLIGLIESWSGSAFEFDRIFKLRFLQERRKRVLFVLPRQSDETVIKNF